MTRRPRPRRVVRAPFNPAGESITLELDVEQWAALDALCARDGLTLDEAVATALEWFISSHPIIAQTRTVQ